MISFKGTVFFDDRKILRKVSRRTRKVLSRFGAFVRITAKQSIRTRKKASAPGQPPSSHSGLLKKFIFFAYEPEKHNVVIGPARLAGSRFGEATHLNEHGGQISKKVFGKRKTAKYPARPYMQPAFEKEQEQLPDLWRDSIV